MRPVALVTGASRGIGLGIALELAEAGYDLTLNYASNSSAATQARAACLERGKAQGIRVECVQADISQAEEREKLVNAVRGTFGGLQLLVNNAGVAPETRSDLLEATEESMDRLLSINLKGPYFLTQSVARWMIEQASTNPRNPGKIITITSISAYTASVNRGDYCISKAGLAMLTPLFAARLAEHCIGVYEIRPGIIATDMTSAVKAKYDELIAGGLTPIKRWGTPADVGKAVRAIAEGLLPFSTGEVINVDGGFHLRTL